MKFLSSKLPFSLLFALIYTVVGTLIGYYVATDAIGDGYDYFPISAGLAAFVSAWLLGYIMIGRTNNHSTKQAIKTGIFTGILAHPVSWYFQILGANICYWTTGQCLSSLGEEPANLLEAIVISLGLSLWSLFFMGWATVIAAVLITVNINKL